MNISIAKIAICKVTDDLKYRGTLSSVGGEQESVSANEISAASDSDSSEGTKLASGENDGSSLPGPFWSPLMFRES